MDQLAKSDLSNGDPMASPALPLNPIGSLLHCRQYRDNRYTLEILDPEGKSYIDDTFYCTQAFFDELLEYNTSLPSGTRFGKLWKKDCRTTEDKMKARMGEGVTGFKLGEYYDIGDPKKVGIRWRKIVIVNVVED